MSQALRNFETSDGQQFAPSAVSPNGRFVLVWRDSDGKGCGGARATGKGRFWLFDERREICKGELERPNGGCVSNQGRFALEDWLFSSALVSAFHVFAPDGSALLKKRLRANLSCCSIADDGNYSVCMTACNPASSDSHALFLFVLPSGTQVWKEHPPFTPAHFEFAADGTQLAIRPGLGQAHHHFTSCTLATGQQ